MKNFLITLCVLFVLTNVVNAGVIVTLDAADSPTSNLVVGGLGGQWYEMGVFNLSNSDPSPIVITEMKFDTGNSFGIAACTIYGTNINAATVGAQAWITGLSIPVAANSSVSLRVDGMIVPAGDGGVANGTTTSIALDTPNDVKYQLGGQVFYASGSVSGNTMTIVESKPNVALNQNSPHGETLIPGLNELASFDVAADQHGSIFLNKLTFNVARHQNSPDGIPDEFSLRLGSTPLAGVSPVLIADDATSVTFDLGQNPSGFAISAGQLDTLNVFGNLPDFDHQGDWIQLSLPSSDNNSLIYSVHDSSGFSQLPVGNYVGGVSAGVISNGEIVPEPDSWVLLLAAIIGWFAMYGIGKIRKRMLR